MACSNKPIVTQQVVVASPPDGLIRPVEPVKPDRMGVVYGGYKGAFYSVSEAYIATMENIAVHNSRLEEALKYIKTLEHQYDGRKQQPE